MMSSFTCEHCDTNIYDSPGGYTTGCEHYPTEGNRMTHFLVWCPTEGETVEDALRVRTSYPGIAAEAWAREHDAESGEYLVADGQTPITVSVCEEFDQDTITKWRVNGRIHRIYTAYYVDV